MKRVITLLLLFFIAGVVAKELPATEPQPWTDGELAQLLAPVALYPDALLTHVLIASTYPLDIVQAQRWLSANSELSDEALEEALVEQPWDDSVKVLVSFPQLLERLDRELVWMTDLGDAFLQQEARVLDMVQTLRRQAKIAGNLTDNHQLRVEEQDQMIIVQPAIKEIVYVPYYDTRIVYGNWAWYDYPPTYWDWRWHTGHSHRHYISYDSYRGIGWSEGIRLSFRWGFGSIHWHHRQLVLLSHQHRHQPYYRDQIINHRHAKKWRHQPRHRHGQRVAISRGKQERHDHGYVREHRARADQAASVRGIKQLKNTRYHDQAVIWSGKVHRQDSTKESKRLVSQKQRKESVDTDAKPAKYTRTSHRQDSHRQQPKVVKGQTVSKPKHQEIKAVKAVKNQLAQRGSYEKDRIAKTESNSKGHKTRSRYRD